MSKIHLPAALALLLAAAVALAAMIKGAGGLTWNWFLPWVLAPYALLFFALCVSRQPTRSRNLAGLIAAWVVLFVTALFYIQAMWFSTSSTAALVFVFTPVMILIAGLAIWGLGWWLLRWWLGRSGEDA